MSITSDLTAIKNVAEDIKDNKVTNFAYDSTAYANNSVESPDEYDWSQHNNIPKQTLTAMKMTETQIDKGWRLRFPILNKYFFNAFFGRVSYNLNKLSDFFHSAVDALINGLGAPYGVATLDSAGRIPSSQIAETLMAYKGTWSALTNTPALSDGMSGAVKGDMYLCDEAGTVTFGTGNTISFQANDRVVYNGSTWFKWVSGRVKSVCGLLPDTTGNVDLSSVTNVTTLLSREVITNFYNKDIGSFWKKCSGGDTYAFRGVAYGNHIWVASSVGQGLWWSEDGINWVQSSTSEIASYTFCCAYYLNGVWIAGSDSQGVWWSADGKTWTQGTGLISTAIVYHINFADNLFVAGSSAGVWWSNDGKAWTQGTGIGTSYYTSTVKKIKGIWLACTQNGMWWSNDGKAWTQGTGNITTYGMNNVTYGGRYFVAVGSSCGIWYSTDGKAWTVTSTTTIQSYTFNSICYVNGIFVASSNSYGLWYSANGSAWTRASNNASLGAIVYANSVWISCSTANGIWLSYNGYEWSNVYPINSQVESPFANISFANGMFVLGSIAGLYYSDWTLFV